MGKTTTMEETTTTEEAGVTEETTTMEETTAMTTTIKRKVKLGGSMAVRSAARKENLEASTQEAIAQETGTQRQNVEVEAVRQNARLRRLVGSAWRRLNVPWTIHFNITVEKEKASHTQDRWAVIQNAPAILQLTMKRLLVEKGESPENAHVGIEPKPMETIEDSSPDPTTSMASTTSVFRLRNNWNPKLHEWYFTTTTSTRRARYETNRTTTYFEGQVDFYINRCAIGRSLVTCFVVALLRGLCECALL